MFNLFGDVSYPLYVLHVPFFELLIYLKVGGGSYFYIILTLSFCFAIDLFFDKPLKTIIKKKYQPRQNYLNKEEI